MSKLIILGAGGHGRVVAEIASLMKHWDEIVFLDDDERLKEVNGYKVIDKLRNYKLYQNKYEDAFVAIGNNRLRLNLIENLVEEGFKCPVLMHPFTAISSNVQIDEGTVVMAGVVINTNSIIGRGCIINTSSSIDHDCTLEDGVHISPGAHICGTSHIGKCTWVCTGASIVNNIEVGSNSIIAAGSAVTKDIIDNVLVGGVPAKEIRDLKQGARI